MESFEKYLVENGYLIFRHDSEKEKLISCDHIGFSTMNPLRYIYKKEGKMDIVFGLGEPNLPPTVLRPQFILFKDKNGRSWSHTPQHIVSRAFQEYSNEEILEFIERGLLIYNETYDTFSIYKQPQASYQP